MYILKPEYFKCNNVLVVYCKLFDQTFDKGNLYSSLVPINGELL